jgi:hypothetical protein
LNGSYGEQRESLQVSPVGRQVSSRKRRCSVGGDGVCRNAPSAIANRDNLPLLKHYPSTHGLVIRRHTRSIRHSTPELGQAAHRLARRDDLGVATVTAQNAERPMLLPASGAPDFSDE